MTVFCRTADAVVIGGGFYGAAISVYLAKTRGLRRVVLIEREPTLLARASFNNQARVHNGYHYPRSYTTAFRSRVNMPRFVAEWPQAINQNFLKLYAVARRNSKVTAKQFHRFCNEIGAKTEPVKPSLKNLFEPGLIEDVFLVEEYAFDATKLLNWAQEELQKVGVVVELKTMANRIERHPDDGLVVTSISDAGLIGSIACRYVFNCTYSGINQFEGDFKGVQTQLKHELTELSLIEPPAALDGLGITVMDGPFFSIMPFPARNLHTLSHVRYTPHLSWADARGINPYTKLKEYERQYRVNRMIRDATRYIPIMQQTKHIESLFEIKTVLVKNEGNDGRPILFEKHADLPGCYSILGGKIDNVFDIFEKLEEEQFATQEDKP